MKRIVSVLLILALALTSLSGCGNKQKYDEYCKLVNK